MAQLVAHLLCKQRVRGSSPLTSTREANETALVKKAPAEIHSPGSFAVPGVGFSRAYTPQTSTVQSDEGANALDPISAPVRRHLAQGSAHSLAARLFVQVSADDNESAARGRLTGSH